MPVGGQIWGSGSIRFRPVWADSLGAKSFCTLVETPSARILIDPGVAVMHPSFPAPTSAKLSWRDRGRRAILEAARLADVVVITHYHYDHFTDFEEAIYLGKTVMAKSPNEYINDSQRARAEKFYSRLFAAAGLSLDDEMREPIERDYPNPMDELPIASSRDFGDYSSRRAELLSKGLEWFKKRVERWRMYRRIPEVRTESLRLVFADGREYSLGSAALRFTRPMFHGIEYSRVGWVIGLVVSCGREKLVYTSDVNGPIIEDYAGWIIREKPNYLLLDGPATYTLGYMLNKTNLARAIANITRIIREACPDLILLDHHLPREPRFRERLAEVYRCAEREGVAVLTVAEHLGRRPAVLEYT